MFVLSAPSGALSLALHPSLFRGLCDAVGLETTSFGGAEADSLDAWAIGCDNPSGQRADLARSIAALVRVSGTLAVREPAPRGGGFWELAAR